MTLAEYMHENRVSLTEMARRIGRPVSTVFGWKAGTKRPEWEAIPLIEAATGGQVRAEDFVPRNAA